MSEPRQPKKRKLAGFGRPELEEAYHAVLKLQDALNAESAKREGASVPDDDFDDRVLAIAEARMEAPQSLSFPNVDDDDLPKLNIIPAGRIRLKPGFDERISGTPSLKADGIWSSDHLYRHLNWLESVVARKTEAAARTWIDALIFRASTMLSSDKRMVLTMDYAVPSVNISSLNVNLSGIIDYAAIVTNHKNADPQFVTIKSNMGDSTGFFIVKAKLYDPAYQVSEAVAALFACAKYLGKQVVRGTLTNGHEWIFILVKLNDDRDGASFLESDIIRMWAHPEGPTGPRVMIRPYPDLIAGILSHWMQHSFVELASDDWFEVR